MAPVGAALAAVGVAGLLGRAGIPLRAAGAGVLATTAALQVDNARSKTVPGASDNATGVAATIALAERIAAQPFSDVETLVVLTGCEEAGMDGMAAFLAAHGDDLTAATTLVLGLDTLGAGTPIVCDAEGALLTHRYRTMDLALADRGAVLAGEDPPRRWRIGGWTDPILARQAHLPAISLLSMGPDGAFTNYHVATDTPDRVDWESVRRCTAIATGIAHAYASR
jgi:hypothetical protein